MAASSFPLIEVRFFKNNGDPAAGFYLDQFASGTEDDQDTWTDYAGTVPNAHPIVLDEWGRCVMFGTPGQAYTFRLRDPVTGAAVWARDNLAPAPALDSTQYVPLDGSVAMTGLLELSGPGTGDLNPVTLLQMNDALAAQTTAMEELVATATEAAEEATAAVAALKPGTYILATENGSVDSMDVDLLAGTYSVILLTKAFRSEAGGTTYSITVTQEATVGSTTVTTSFPMHRSGGSGYGRDVYGSDFAVGTLVLEEDETVEMSMAAVSLGGIATGGGSLLIVTRQNV